MSDSGSMGVPGTRRTRGSRCAWLASTASRWLTAQPVMPSPSVKLMRRAHDLVRVPVADDEHGLEHPVRLVGLVDRERVVRDQLTDGVGDAHEEGVEALLGENFVEDVGQPAVRLDRASNRRGTAGPQAAADGKCELPLREESVPRSPGASLLRGIPVVRCFRRWAPHSSSPRSSHSRQTQSPSRTSSALSAAGTMVTPHRGQIGARSSSRAASRATSRPSRTRGRRCCSRSRYRRRRERRSRPRRERRSPPSRPRRRPAALPRPARSRAPWP